MVAVVAVVIDEELDAGEGGLAVVSDPDFDSTDLGLPSLVLLGLPSDDSLAVDSCFDFVSDDDDDDDDDDGVDPWPVDDT